MCLNNVRLLVSEFDKMFLFYRDIIGFKVTWGNVGEHYAHFKTGDSGELGIFSKSMMAHAVGTSNHPSKAFSQDNIALIFSVNGLIDSYVSSSFTNIEQIDELDLLVHFARDLGGRYGLEFTLNKEELVKLSANKRLNYLLEKAKVVGTIASAENIGDLEQLIQQYKRNEKAMIRHQLLSKPT